MKGKSKKSIIILIVLLAIGFAAVTTTLTINGVIKIGANQENFDVGVKFVDGAYLEYSDTAGHVEGDHGSVQIESNGNYAGKKLTFETGVLKNIGETVTLKYQIENGSQYYAQLKGMTCTLSRADSSDESYDTNGSAHVKGEYVELSAEDINGIVLDPKGQDASISNEHTVVIKMIKSFVGKENTTEDNYTVTCTINAQGLADRPEGATTENATRHTTQSTTD